MFLILSIFFNSIGFRTYFSEKQLNKTQEQLWYLEEEATKIINQLKAKETLTISNFATYYEEDFTLLYYKNNELTYWSNKKPIPLSIVAKTSSKNGSLLHFQDQAYFFTETIKNQERFIYIKPLKINKKQPFLGNSKNVVSFKPAENYRSKLFIPLVNKAQERIGTISANPTNATTIYLTVSWLLFSILFLIATTNLFTKLPRLIFGIHKSIWILFILFIEKEILKTDPFSITENLEIFQPNIYANRYIGQSLGLLIYNITIIAMAGKVWYSSKAQFRLLRTQSKFVRYAFFTLFLSFIFFVMSYAIRSVVIDTSASYSFEVDNIYSLILLLFLFTGLYLYLAITLRIVRFTKRKFSERSNLIGLFITIAISTIILLPFFSKKEVLFLIPWEAITIIYIYYIVHNKEFLVKKISGFVVYFILASVFCAYNLQQYTTQKNNQSILQTARKISLEEDDLSAFLIEQDLKDAILSDSIMQNLINNPFISQQTIIRRIKNKHLDERLKSYNIDFNIFQSKELIEPQLISNSDYSHFRYNLSVPFKRNNQNINLQIAFEKPKVIENTTLTNQSEYSYAFYKNGVVEHLKGNLTKINPTLYTDIEIGDSRLFRQNGITTLIYKNKIDTFVQVDANAPMTQRNPLLLFTNFFASLFFIFIVYLLITNRFKLTNAAFFRTSLANRIQFLILSILYITGFVVVAISMRTSSSQLHKVEQAKYQTKLNNAQISNNERIFSLRDKKPTADILLYNSNGKLFNTVNHQEEIDDLINPKVWSDFSNYPIENITIEEKDIPNAPWGFYKSIRNSNSHISKILYLPAYKLKDATKQQRKLIYSSQFNSFSIVIFTSTLLSLFISQTLTNTFLRLRDRLLAVSIGHNRKLIEWNTEDELGTLIQEYNELVKKLDENAVVLARNERENAWRDVAKQVAHEIKNPLTPMKLSIQHLKRRIDVEESETNEAIVRTLTSLETQVNNLENIANNFSSLSKMDLPVFKNTNIIHLANKIIPMYDEDRTFDLVFENTITDNEPIIYADKTMITRVLNNLLKNAQQAFVTNRRGRIEVILSEADNNYIINVTDNGKGIATQNRAKIFTPNFTTKNSGTGIGLMMSRKIIELHKGTIQFESQEGFGTTFTIKLPKTHL